MTAQVGTPRAALAGWAAVVALVVYLVFVGGGWAGIYDVTLRTISVALIAAVLLAWGVVAFRRPDWRPRSAIWPAFLVPLLVFALSTVTSRYPRVSAEYLAYAVLLTGLYLLLQRLLAHEFVRARIGALAAMLCSAIGIAYVGIVVADWIRWWDLIGHVAAPPLRPEFAGLTFGNPSAVLTMAVLLLAAGIAGLGLDTAPRRAVALALTALAAVVALLTGSRAGWLALAIGVAVLGSVWILAPGHRGLLGRWLGRRRVRVGLAALGLGAVAVAVAVLPGVLIRAGAGGEGLRLQYVAVATRIFASTPLVGSGPGTWVVQRVAYTHAGESDFYIPHAHDIYVQTAAEFGLAGIAAGAIVVACLAWLVIGALRGTDPDRRRWGLAALFALAYLAAHSTLDFYANMPAALFALAVPVAYLDATSPRSIRLPAAWSPASSRRLATLARLATAAAVLVSIGFLGWSERAASTMADATAAANAGDWQQARSLSRAGVSADPGLAPYQLTVGLAESHTGDLEAAARAFQRAAKADDLPESWLDLASTQLALGEKADARASVDQALRLGRQQPVVAYAAGFLLDELGDSAAADDAYVTALVGDGLFDTTSLAGDPSWTTLPGLAPRWPGILDRVIAEVPPGSAWSVALVAGRTDEATALAPRAGDPGLAELIIRGWAGDAAAIAGVEAQAIARPLDPTAVTWAARLDARAGRSTDADRFRAMAEILDPGLAGATYEVRVAWDQPSGYLIAGDLAQYYGQYTYRRPTPWDALAAGLPRLVYR